VSDKTEHPPIPEKFAQLGVRNSILRALAELKFLEPSEIQTLLIPRALAGVDLLGQARTGTGKTAAFAIPILQMAERGRATQAIVMVPTRELAVQVESEFQRLSLHTPIRTVAVYGGQKIAAQVKRLHAGPEVLVGTPGRVMDLLERRIINFQNMRFVVLDEVDRMLDIGFRDDIRRILSQLKGLKRMRGDEGGGGGESDAVAHQTVFVSATISDEIEKLSRQFMRSNAEKLIAPGADDRPTVEKVEQRYISAQPWDKYRALRALLEIERPQLGIVFTRTKHGAQKLAKKLFADGIECREIHGDLAQNKRDRVMKSFRGGKFDLLIATDLASRGIDVQDITHIINYDIPEDPEVYVHRVGRTARMGAVGKAFTFVSRDQGQELTKIESLINMVLPKLELEGFNSSPPPSDWIERDPGLAPSEPRKQVQSRFSRPMHGVQPGGNQGGQQGGGQQGGNAGGQSAGQSGDSEQKQVSRTIGSKIPVNRRRKRMR
jgi:ATP-dependent RNA helicase DeaD